MKPEEQQLAIAKTLGWTQIRSGTQDKNDPEPRGWLPPGVSDWKRCRSRLPDFLNDLNAMHEVEKSLSEVNEEEYLLALYRVVEGLPPGSYAHWSDNAGRTTSATAAQRAEAFLRTLYLWQE